MHSIIIMIFQSKSVKEELSRSNFIGGDWRVIRILSVSWVEYFSIGNNKILHSWPFVKLRNEVNSYNCLDMNLRLNLYSVRSQISLRDISLFFFLVFGSSLKYLTFPMSIVYHGFPFKNGFHANLSSSDPRKLIFTKSLSIWEKII